MTDNDNCGSCFFFIFGDCIKNSSSSYRVKSRGRLIENKDLLARMPEAEIRSAMDPANYTGGAKEIVDMMVAEVESVLGQKV